jgi:hypothetical protein
MRRRLVVVVVDVVVSLLLSVAALSLFCLTAAVLVQAQDTGTGGDGAQTPHYECQFSAPLELTAGVRLESVKNVEAGTFTMRLTYTEGLGWVSIGVNSEGGTKMVPGTAVIGRIEYDVDGMCIAYTCMQCCCLNVTSRDDVTASTEREREDERVLQRCICMSVFCSATSFSHR